MKTPDEPLLRPTSNELAVAPELGVLAVLDATLAVAAHQILSENPDIYSLELAACGELPSPPARMAIRMIHQIGELRAAMREYKTLAAGDNDTAF